MEFIIIWDDKTASKYGHFDFKLKKTEKKIIQDIFSEFVIPYFSQKVYIEGH
jgi:hypothetical protein